MMRCQLRQLWACRPRPTRPSLVVENDTPSQTLSPVRSMPITPERAEIFLDALRKTGSYNAAAAAASPHLVKRGSKHCSIRAFREYARRNPEFAMEVEAAMGEVRGR